MVCAQGAAFCVVRDVTGGAVQSFNVAAGCTVFELFQEVGKRMRYHHDSFELVLQLGKDAVILNENKEQTIETAGLKMEPGEKNSILLLELKGRPLEKVPDPCPEDDLGLGASASPTSGGDMTTPLAPPPPPPSTSASATYTGTVVRHDTGYVGLVNQAMTCYLNSLLQALYMTPEFRNALYNWEFDGSPSDESKSIPYQLQKLFLNLQTSHRSAVETTELTRSFGWDSSEAWQQHDIQELCRVMFDALEQKFKNTEQSDLINRLYEGKMIDYVKCLECCTEKSREDTFLDIPLPVRPFGSNVAYGSVEEALRAFVQPETLDGNNQYLCERCSKKCDAHKGLKFSKFPYLLTLHLKRFDFDYNTLHRIKLNDKVSFPEKLNLNGFVTEPTLGGVAEVVSDETLVKCDDSSTTDSGSALDDEGCQPIDSASVVNHDNHTADYQEDDEGIDVSNQQDRDMKTSSAPETGPYLYELFSIMIHSGSATGGHYYAYIKDLRQGEWLCFNDQSVTRITYEDIRKTYGGGPLRGYYSGAYSSSTNAYMLMYRQIDPERNTGAMVEEEFPPHLQALYRRIEEQKDREQRMKERELDMCKLKLYCNHPQQNLVVDTKLYISNDCTLKQTVSEAYSRLNLENVVPVERCRLVSYDRLKDSIECSFEGKDEEPIGELFRNSKHDFLLEIRGETDVFQVYKPGNINTKVLVLKLDEEDVDGPYVVQSNLSQTVAEYKQAIAKRIKASAESLFLVLEKYSNEPRMLYEDEATLKSEGFYGSNKIYVAYVTEADEQRTVLEKMRGVIDKFEHIITLHMSLPSVNKEVLEKLNIPPLEQQHELCAPSKPLSRGPSPCDRQERESSPQPAADTEDECLGPDQSASEDSSLTDSERTIVGEAPGDCLTQLSACNSPAGSEHNASSPENETNDLCNCKRHTYTKKFISSVHQDDVWTGDEDSDTPTRSTSYYLKATPYTEGHGDTQRVLKVMVDKRMSLRALKLHLEPHVGVSSDHFKVFRPHNSQSETECTRLNESLSIYRDEERLTVKLGRALRKGECSGNVYLLAPNSTDPVKFLCEWIIAKGAAVSQVKKDILDELRRKSLADIPYSRCRLRQKNWKNPTKPMLDGTTLDTELMANWELFVQELPHEEQVTSSSQRLLFVRQWCPASLELKQFDEVVLDSNNVTELKEKISVLSSIPVENVDIAKALGSFPCSEASVLAIHSDLDWNPATSYLDSWPLSLSDDGHVIIYRDNREKIKQLSSEEKKDIISRENRSKVTTTTSIFSYSPKKERALKIYLDTTPSSRRDDLDVD